MNVPRSKLFLAGDRLDELAQAMAAGADALSIDLEDAVAEAEKAASRDAVARLLRESRLPIQVWVRVNGADSGHLVHDLQALRGAHVDVINLPKAETPGQVEFVHRMLDPLGEVPGRSHAPWIVPTIESARGLRHAADIAAASPRVLALQLGAGDLARSTGITDRTAGLATLRTLLSLAAAEAGVASLDSTAHDVVELAAFEADARAARALGMRGKSCMHASHAAIANLVFAGASRATPP